MTQMAPQPVNGECQQSPPWQGDSVPYAVGRLDGHWMIRPAQETFWYAFDTTAKPSCNQQYLQKTTMFFTCCQQHPSINLLTVKTMALILETSRQATPLWVTTALITAKAIVRDLGRNPQSLCEEHSRVVRALNIGSLSYCGAAI